MRRKRLRRLVGRRRIFDGLVNHPVAFHPGEIVERRRLLVAGGRRLGSGSETGVGNERRDESDRKKNAAATKGHSVLDRDSAAIGNPSANPRDGREGKERNEAVW